MADVTREPTAKQPMTDAAQSLLRTAEREEWLSVKEYAALKRVHVETAKRWCRRGLVKAERAGRRGHWRVLVMATVRM